MNVFNQFKNTIGEIMKLKKFPQSVLSEQISHGKWSIREIIGHMFYWDKFNLEKMVPNMFNGAMLPPFPDHDLHNQESVSYLDKYDSVEAIMDAFVITRKHLIEKITMIDNDIKFKIENEPHEFSTESFIEIFVEHDSHHLKQIQEKLKHKEFKIEQLPI
jgi:hypothetical protein